MERQQFIINNLKVDLDTLSDQDVDELEKEPEMA